MWAVVLSGPGCAAPPSASTPPLSTAWQERDGSAAAARKSLSRESPDATKAPIATVNGRPVAAGQLVDLLLRSHGPGLLEQLVALYAAEDLAAKKSLSITDADVDRELDLALRRLVNPLAAATTKAFDRAEAERILETVLSDRNISREEFFLPLRRNAYLRKIAQAEISVTDVQLRDEYDRRFGERVRVRHIQLASSPEASRMQERLAAGETIADLAARYSANTASAKEGGMLDPISAGDDAIPENLRRAAFALQPGQISGVIRVGEWYHILKLEERLAPQQPDLAGVREELARTVRDRLTEARMRELYEQTLAVAAVEVQDPVLREAYMRRVQQRKK
jgi:foldase protein PrsA